MLLICLWSSIVAATILVLQSNLLRKFTLNMNMSPQTEVATAETNEEANQCRTSNSIILFIILDD